MDSLSLPIPKLGKEVVDKKAEMNLVDRLYGKTYREQKIMSPRGKKSDAPLMSPRGKKSDAPLMSPRLPAKSKSAISLKQADKQAEAKPKSKRPAFAIDNMVARLFGRTYKEQQLMSPRKKSISETLQSGWRSNGGSFQTPASPRAKEIEVAREEVRKEECVKRLRRKKRKRNMSAQGSIGLSTPTEENTTQKPAKSVLIASIPVLAIPTLGVKTKQPSPDACSDCESSVASSSTSESDYLWETDSGSDIDDDYEYQYRTY